MRNFLLLCTLLSIFSCTNGIKMEVEEIHQTNLQYFSPTNNRIICSGVQGNQHGQLIVTKYGELHNSILAEVHSNNFDFENMVLTESTFDTITSFIISAIENISGPDTAYVSTAYLPDYSTALEMGIVGHSEVSHTDDDGLSIYITNAEQKLALIDTIFLKQEAKDIIQKMLEDIAGYVDLDFQTYMDSMLLVQHPHSRFIGSAIIAIASSSMCYWEDFYQENVQMRIWPIIAAFAAADVGGAIVGVWIHGARKFIGGNFDAGSPGEWGNVMLDGAISGSATRNITFR